MKNKFLRLSLMHISLLFVICAVVLVANVIILWHHSRISCGESVLNGFQMSMMFWAVANIVVLAVVVFLCCLIRYYFLKNMTLESELQHAEDSVGAQVSERTAQLAALAHHLMHVAEEEKAKLARELHSEFGACFSIISMDISVIAARIEETDTALTGKLEHVLATIRDVTELKRRIIADLRPNLLDSLGLPFCLTDYAMEFSKTNDIPVNTLISEEFDQIDSSCAIVLFRVAQEAMMNVVKHADASGIQLTLQPKDRGVSLIVADDGKGIPRDAVLLPENHGLAGMRERMLALGGTLTVRNKENERGTEIEAYLPIG